MYDYGEVGERSKALDWNSSNIFTGVRGFESHPLRQLNCMPKCIVCTRLSIRTNQGGVRTHEPWTSGFDKIAWSNFARRAASGPEGLGPGWSEQSHPPAPNEKGLSSGPFHLPRSLHACA